MRNFIKGLVMLGGVVALTACTQETQNKVGRAIQNWTGTNGVLEVYAGDRLVRRFEFSDYSTSYIFFEHPHR